MVSAHEFAKKYLGQEDESQKSYFGKLNGRNGLLVMSKKKLLFVKEEGLIRKNYSVILDSEYDKIGSVKRKGREIEINITGKGKQIFSSVEVPMSIVEKSLMDLI